MPARTGRQYLNGLREQDREVWLAGERVKDVTTHPGLKNGARAIASLYDMQSDPKLRDEMTYVSPTTGDRVGLSFIVPRTREDLEKRRVMMLNWARTTCGMMGRSPDFMNVTYAAWAGAADYFTQGLGRPEFAENMRNYYEYIRENDLTLTHSLINLQRSRTSRASSIREGTVLVGDARDRRRHRRARRPDPGDPPLADEIGVYSPRRRAMPKRTARQWALPSRRHAGTPVPVPREL
jgi:4-hydroxyphenylacetate 3-monooxygenase